MNTRERGLGRARPAICVMCICLCSSAAAFALDAPAAETALAREVDACLERAREALVSGGELEGAAAPGTKALAALAALRAGAAADDPPLARALRSVFACAMDATADGYGGTYNAGLFLVLIDEVVDEAVNEAVADLAEEVADGVGNGTAVAGAALGAQGSAVAMRALAGRLARRLIELQEASGGWGDISRTEFAAMGLRAAERLGVRVPGEVRRGLVRFVRARRLPDGGWGYREGDPATGSMTAGGVVALLCAGVEPGDHAVRQGLAWLRKRFTVDANPGERKPGEVRPGEVIPAAATSPGSGSARHRFYYLAGLASLARANGAWPERRWAVEAARALVAEQGPDGRWRGDAQDRPTELATMFLAEARRVLWGGARTGRITVGVCSPSRGGALRARRLPDGTGAALARALGRWSDLRADVRFERLDPGRVGTWDLAPGGRYAFVLLLAGPGTGRGGGDDPRDRILDELSAFVGRGGAVVIEGDAEGDAGGERGVSTRLADLAARLCAAGRDGAVAGGVPLARAPCVTLGPAPLDPAEAPLVLTAGGAPPVGGGTGHANVLVAPRGIFSLLGKGPRARGGPAGRGGPGADSAVARAAVNVFAWAVSR